MSHELPPPPPRKKLKRRANILYRLRKKDVSVNTRTRTIFYKYGENPDAVLQIRQLREEFNFNVQFKILDHEIFSRVHITKRSICCC